MKLKPEDVEIEQCPPWSGGMRTGAIRSGVSVTHKPTGTSVTVTHYRDQWRNKEQALLVLDLLVEDMINE